MKEETSAGAAKIEQAECNQARLRLLRRSLFYLKNSSKKLHAIDILRKFASGMSVVSDCLRTLRTSKMISITLPFDSRKSRKLKRISQWIASDAHTYMAWAAPAVLLIRVVREPTWAKYRRVCSRLFFLSIAIMPMAATAQNSLHAKSTRTYKLKNSKTYHNTMPQIIKIGGGLFSKGELLRINPSNNFIESSGNSAVRGFPAAQTLLMAPSVTCSPSVVRSLPSPPVASMSRPTPAAASRHVALTPLLMVTSSTCRTRATPCSPTPARACTTPRTVEEAG